jgi:hypothetical protein
MQPAATTPHHRLIPPRLISARVSIASHVVRRKFAAETVVLDLEAGEYFGLNPTAGRMMELLEETGSVPRTLDQLISDFELPGDELARDLCQFCNELAERGLVKLA